MTRETVENYRIEITIGTMVVVVLFLFGTAFKLGADQTKVETDIVKIAEQTKECKQEATEQKKVNQAVSTSLTEIKSDIKYIKEAVDKLDRHPPEKKGRE